MFIRSPKGLSIVADELGIGVKYVIVTESVKKFHEHRLDSTPLLGISS